MLPPTSFKRLLAFDTGWLVGLPHPGAIHGKTRPYQTHFTFTLGECHLKCTLYAYK